MRNKNNWRRLCASTCACGCGELVAKKFKKGHGRRRPIAERLMEKVDRRGDCWIWTGAVANSGYGRIGEAGSRTLQAHRASYEAFRGTIPAGLHIDHLCRNRLCVNPDHLEPVTPSENNRRAAAANRQLTGS